MLPPANEDTPKHLLPPPPDASFWELFDYFWARGLGNALHPDGTPMPWTAAQLETAFDGTPDIRSVENWQSRAHMPSPDNIRKLSWVISGGDDRLRKAWHEALISARLAERRKNQDLAKAEAASAKPVEQDKTNFTPGVDRNAPAQRRVPLWFGAALLVTFVGLISWFIWNNNAGPKVLNMRICDAPYFDKETKKCTQHVSVYVHGIDEVFLSFDFNGVDSGAPFERWWILNGERVAGRTSFNDEAWPGYTYWRPGVLAQGQYVVRIVVDGEVFTQTFFVQKEGFSAVTSD